MASKAGPRARGTDGTDFMHRERVASHYKASSQNKWRMKCVCLLHLMLVILMAFRLSVAICVIFGVRPPSFLQKLRLPRAQMWEYWWLASLIPAVFALLSLRKNRTMLIKQYVLGIITFGLGPVLFAVYGNLDDLLLYWKSKETTLLFLGYPMVILWNMFLAITLQIHVFGLYFAWQLIKAWRPKSDRKKLS